MDERQLIRLAQSGDEAATEELINRYRGLMFSVCRKVVNRFATPDELFGDAILGFYKALKYYTPREQYEGAGKTFNNYLYTIVEQSVRRSDLRQPAIRIPYHADNPYYTYETLDVDDSEDDDNWVPEPGYIDNFENEVANKDEVDWLLSQLNPTHRDILTRRGIHREPRESIAEAYNRTIGWVDQVYFHARKMAKIFLGTVVIKDRFERLDRLEKVRAISHVIIPRDRKAPLNRRIQRSYTDADKENVLTLRKNGLSYSKIAAQTDIPQGTVVHWVHNA